ncbi:MAG: phage terminase large subunit [Porticoccus sp.]|nr:phage terminase large subunit [Porticoccus sp.]
MFTDSFNDDELERLTQKEFLSELASFRFNLQSMLEAECEGFDPDPAASAERRATVQEEFKFFCYTYFPHYIKSAPSAFQRWVYETLPQLIDAPKGCKQAVAAPRGNAKSTLLTQLFVLWCILTGRKWYVAIIMDAFDQAVMMLEAIKVELESNPRLKQDFPSESGAGRVWQAGVIVTRNGRKVQAAGSGKRLRGWRHGPYRPDLTILDDIENDENVKKIEQRKKTEDWIDKAVLKLGPPDGSMDVLYVGTVLHYDSVLSRKLKSPTWQKVVFKAIVRYPDRMDLWEEWEEILVNQSEESADQFYAQNKMVMDAGAVVSWSEMQPLELLMKFRADGRKSFDSEYQNDPANSEDAIFKEIYFWVQQNRDWVFYGSCDPSMGKKKKSNDPSATLVGGMDRNSGVLCVVEASIAKKHPDKIITDVIEFQREYGCMLWVVESVQFQEFFKDEMVKRSAAAGVPVPARGVIPHTDKGLRIEALAPHISNELILLHRSQTTLYEQIRFWPEADHDDGPDALDMLWRAALTGAGGLPHIMSARPRYLQQQHT